MLSGNIFEKLKSYLLLALAYTKLNWKAQLEYRGAFISQVAAMFFNDCIWLAFWTFFFTRFRVAEGWSSADVVTLWAVSAAGFGIAHAICGNLLYLASTIARGELDSWLLYPRALLPHLALGRMSATSVGDAIFGYAVYLAFARPDVPHFLLFVLLTLSVAVLFVGFSILSATLSFWIGNSETVTEQWRFALVTFSTYPADLFKGGVKVLLYTLIPAAFVTYFPLKALKDLSLLDAGLSFAGSAAVLVVGSLVFYCGLNRYESGNTMTMKG